jgi:hypothetical protein
MTPLLQSYLTLAIRWLLTIAGAWLTARGVMTNDGAAKLVLDFTPAIVGVIWGVITAHWGNKLIATAQALPAGATRHEVEREATRVDAPPASLPRHAVPTRLRAPGDAA